MEAVVTRSIAGAGLAFVLLVGGWVGSRLTLAIADEVELALARRVDPDQAQREALRKKASYEDSEAFYETTIDDAVTHHGITAPSLDSLRAPNTFYHVASVSDPKLVSPGGNLREAGFELRVVVSEVEIDRRGLRTKNTHTMANIRNAGDKPLAYFLRLRGKSGDCGVRAVTRYDVMVLMPGEKAELSVCAGTQDVEILDLRLMEVTELGALWVSKIPPQAVGHDDITSRSHAPGPGIEMCAEIPGVEMSARIANNEAQWEDIVDFYSRHDCEQFRWWSGYRRIVEPLERLPAVPPP